VASRSFYDELVNKDFYQEKTASTKDEIKGVLDSFSTEEMEAIAAELGLLSEKTAAEETQSLESKVLTQVEKKNQEDAKDRANEAKVEGGEGKTEETQATDSETTEESKTNTEKEQVVNPQAKAHENNSSQPNTVNVPNAEKEEEHTPEEKTKGEYSSEEKEAMVLEAYNVAFEKLASAGYTLEDYVFSKVANESIAVDIAEQAEKLAYVTEQNPLKVADDIIGAVYGILGEE
jgi:hypothetical protein